MKMLTFSKSLPAGLLASLFLLLSACGLEDPHALADADDAPAMPVLHEGDLLELDDYKEPVPPLHIVHIDDYHDVGQLFGDGVAHFELEQKFSQLSGMIDAHELDRLQYRVPLAGGEWSPWQEVEITWNEGFFFNVLVRLDEPTRELQLRGGEFILSTHLEFYEERLARDEFLHGPQSSTLPEAELPTTGDEDLRTTTQAAVPPSSLVISRAQWGAINPNKICGNVVTPWRMAIHHTAAPSNDGGDPAARMRQMQSYHMNNLGWCDIGYHFVVAQSGQIFQGRSRANRPGGHVGGHNSGNVGISFIANFQTQTPTNTQLDAGARIIRWVHDTYNVPLNRDRIRGHREHSGQSTACPGNNMISHLNNLVSRAQNMGSAAPPAVNEQGCTAQQAQNCGNYGCGCVNGQCSGGYCDGSGCTAQQESNCGYFGCGCVDGQCSGGYCPGSGCTAKRTNDCGNFGCGCVDGNCAGGFCADSGCTAKQQNDCAAFGCGCVDGKCDGGFCAGSGCTAKQQNDCAAFGCGCVDGQCDGGFCGGTGCTAKQQNDCAAFGCGCSNGQCAGGFCGEPGSQSNPAPSSGSNATVENADCSSLATSPLQSPFALFLLAALGMIALRRRS